MKARLEKRTQWQSGGEGRWLIKVRCNALNRRGASTCRGTIGYTGTFTLAALLDSELGRRFAALAFGEIVDGTRPWIIFGEGFGWSETAGTWTVNRQAHSSRRATAGRSYGRRERVLFEWATKDIDEAGVKQIPDRDSASRAASVSAQGSRGWAYLPVRALCPECAEPQDIDLDVLRAHHLGEYLDAVGLLHGA